MWATRHRFEPITFKLDKFTEMRVRAEVNPDAAERLPASCRHPSTILGLTPAKVPLGRRGLCGAATTILLAARDIREVDPVGNWDAIVFAEAGSRRWQRTRPSGFWLRAASGICS